MTLLGCDTEASEAAHLQRNPDFEPLLPLSCHPDSRAGDQNDPDHVASGGVRDSLAPAGGVCDRRLVRSSTDQLVYKELQMTFVSEEY